MLIYWQNERFPFVTKSKTIYDDELIINHSNNGL